MKTFEYAKTLILAAQWVWTLAFQAPNLKTLESSFQVHKACPGGLYLQIEVIDLDQNLTSKALTFSAPPLSDLPTFISSYYWPALLACLQCNELYQLQSWPVCHCRVFLDTGPHLVYRLDPFLQHKLHYFLCQHHSRLDFRLCPSTEAPDGLEPPVPPNSYLAPLAVVSSSWYLLSYPRYDQAHPSATRSNLVSEQVDGP